MKRITAVLLLLLLLAAPLTGCGDVSPGRVVFTGELLEIHESSILVATGDDVGFDLASVSISDAEIKTNLIVGQSLKVTIDPLVEETYPVRVRATKVELAK